MASAARACWCMPVCHSAAYAPSGACMGTAPGLIVVVVDVRESGRAPSRSTVRGSCMSSMQAYPLVMSAIAAIWRQLVKACCMRTLETSKRNRFNCIGTLTHVHAHTCMHVCTRSNRGFGCSISYNSKFDCCMCIFCIVQLKTIRAT